MKTIRIILTGSFILIVSSLAFSQVQFSVGAKGGLNFANIDASNLGTTYDNRTGYHFGAFSLFKFSKIGIQPEIIFSEQGSNVKNIDTGNAEANFSYINIPVILKLYLVGGLNLQAGPQFGFLSMAEIDDNSVKDFVKSSDVSLGLGAGWDFPFGLSLDLRYNLGLSDNNDGFNTDQLKNQVWQVSAGFKLLKFGK